MIAIWRSGLRHPDEMVPGSFWRLRNEWSLYYLEDWATIDVHVYGYNILPHKPVESLKFELNKIYLLSKIEEKENVYNVIFLGDTHSVETSINKNFWDNIFELVRASCDTKQEKKLIFGHVSIDELKAKLGI